MAKERELSIKQISELQRCIALFKNTPMGVTARDDPYVQNVLVAKQLHKQASSLLISFMLCTLSPS